MQPDRVGAGFRTIEKKCSEASLHLGSICTRRSGTYVEQLDFTDWKGGEIVFRHRVAVYAERQSQPCKVLISCLRAV